ncbi:prenyltransferase nscD [Aspergillus undulatus]|uniref:prenyltransferase nscD n=1 Tax=Aspergillus undulatus TaxID=1810928 RepID=UPI003CCD5473
MPSPNPNSATNQLHLFTTLSRFLPTDNPAHVFWWRTTGRHFALMLHEAAYPIYRQIELLLLHRFSVVPRLGPQPTSATPSFTSRVAPGIGDGSPIGYSWRWGTSKESKPLIRHYIEAIGSLTGTVADPLNEFAGREMLTALAGAVGGVQLDLAWKFAAHIRPQLMDDEGRAVAGSSILIGVQCAPESEGVVDVMAGLMTRDPKQVKDLLGGIFPRAMQDAYGKGVSLAGLEMVRDFVERDPQGKYLKVLGTTAIDCCAPAKSRFKVYVTTANTSFDHIAAVMALGGRKPESEGAIAQLKELWYAVKGLDQEFRTSEQPPQLANGDGSGNGKGPANANVSGVTFYFDIHPKYPYPHVKLQIDVSKHSASDWDAIQAVLGFLERRGQGADAQAYLNVVTAMVSEEELRAKRGLQAFFSFAFKNGEVDITSYFLPQIYRRFAETQAELGLTSSRRRSRFDSY